MTVFKMKQFLRAVFSCLAVYLTAAFGNEQQPTPNYEGATSNVREMGGFIYESAAYVHFGAERERVLDTLLSIATRSRERFYGPRALRALCHLASDRSETQAYLIRVVEAEQVQPVVRETACQYLVYVADGIGREALRKIATAQYPRSLRAPECNALVELGDAEFGDFLAGAIEQMDQGDPDRAVAERQLRRIRVQSSVRSLLASVEHETDDFDPAWVVTQALRHAATREEVRDAVIPYLQQHVGERPSARHYALLRVLDGEHVLTPDDVSRLPWVKQALDRRAPPRDEGNFPPWATRIDELRAEFYRPKQNRANKPAEPDTDNEGDDK